MKRRAGWIALCLWTLAPGASVSPVQAEFTIAATPLWLNPKDQTETQVGRLEYRGGLHLTSDDQRFGGFSGLVVTADGSRMLAVSDKGYWLDATLSYENGKLTGIGNEDIAAMLDTAGRPLGRGRNDAEALTANSLDTDRIADILVGFEIDPRIWLYDLGENRLSATPTPLPRPGLLNLFGGNRGLESLTRLDETTLIGFSEGAIDKSNRFLGILLNTKSLGPDSTALVWLKAFGKYAPTDLARLPDGDLLLLERRYTFWRGPAVRLRLIEKEDVKPRAVLTGEPLAELTSRYAIDNMEGMATRTGEDGLPLLYLISDDNYFRFQRTVLLMFALTPSDESKATNRPNGEQGGSD